MYLFYLFSLFTFIQPIIMLFLIKYNINNKKEFYIILILILAPFIFLIIKVIYNLIFLLDLDEFDINNNNIDSFIFISNDAIILYVMIINCIYILIHFILNYIMLKRKYINYIIYTFFVLFSIIMLNYNFCKGCDFSTIIPINYVIKLIFLFSSIIFQIISFNYVFNNKKTRINLT